MSSDRRSVEGALPDGVADREAGYVHNPNPEDEVAANRARFEEQQRKIQQERAVAAEAIQEVQQTIEAQYHQAIEDPEHQAFVAEQLAHDEEDPKFQRGGQELDGGEYVGPAITGNAEIARHVSLPTTPRKAEEFRREG